MNQIVRFETPKGKFLAVLVPDRFVSAFANMGYLVCKVVNPATDVAEDKFFPPDVLYKELTRISKLPDHINSPAIKLPDGEWKVMGMASKLDENQCDEIFTRTPDSTSKFMFLELISKLGLSSITRLILKKV